MDCFIPVYARPRQPWARAVAFWHKTRILASFFIAIKMTMPHTFFRFAKPLFALALPIMGTQLAQTGMGVIDTIIAGKAGTLDLASIAVGSSIWIPLVLFVSGVMVALTPLTTHAKGTKNKALSRQTLQQGIYVGLIFGTLCMALLLVFTRPVMNLMSVTPDIQAMTEQYLMYIAIGLPGVAIHQALRTYNEAINLTKPVTAIAVFGLLLNIPLNLIFVMGWGPIDAMGGPGCGLASCIIFYLMAGILWLYTLTSKHHQKVQPLQPFSKPQMQHIGDITKVGLPIGLAIFVEVSLFCVIALFIARLGPEVVAAHQITLSISSLLFMVPLSLSAALTVRVGQELGKGKPEQAKLAWKNGILINLLFAIFNGLILYGFRDEVVGLYSQDALVVGLATHLLLFAAIFQISDGLQVGAAGALRAYNDTFITLLITIIAFWLVGLPLGYYLGLSQQAPLGAEGFWIGLVAGLSVNALLLWLRLQTVSRNYRPLTLSQ